VSNQGVVVVELGGGSVVELGGGRVVELGVGSVEMDSMLNCRQKHQKISGNVYLSVCE
jgi:hypothetical protein